MMVAFNSETATNPHDSRTFLSTAVSQSPPGGELSGKIIGRPRGLDYDTKCPLFATIRLRYWPRSGTVIGMATNSMSLTDTYKLISLALSVRPSLIAGRYGCRAKNQFPVAEDAAIGSLMSRSCRKAKKVIR
jgi:hypothetical protein